MTRIGMYAVVVDGGFRGGAGDFGAACRMARECCGAVAWVVSDTAGTFPEHEDILVGPLLADYRKVQP